MTRESHLLQALFLAPVDGDDASGQMQGQALLRGPKATAILGDFVGSQQVHPLGEPWSQRQDHLPTAFILAQIFAWMPVYTFCVTV